VILKAITPPSLSEFQGLMAEASGQAKKAGMKKADVAAAIKKVRRKR
jgi:hypothetical protein